MAIYIVYPETRWVSDQQIEMWYDDAVANNKVQLGQQRATTVHAMAKALQDIGQITMATPPGGRVLACSVALLLAATSVADAGTRCRTTRSGSTTYTTCEGGSGGKVNCRSSRSGSTTYTTCR